MEISSCARDRILANVSMGEKRKFRYYRLISLAMVSGKILKWIINQMAWKPLETYADHRETKLVQQE